MPPERLLYPTGVYSFERKQFPERLDAPEGEISMMEISGRRVDPTGDVIGADVSLFF